jgi:hypothetical protein
MSDAPLPPGITPQDLAEMQRMIARCWIVGALVIGLPLEDLDRLTGVAETVGPIAYPEVWRANAEKILQDREMIRALAQARRALLTVGLPGTAAAVAHAEQTAAEVRVLLDRTFRDLLTRPDIGRLPSLVILSGLVRYVAFRAPMIDASKDKQ